MQNIDFISKRKIAYIFSGCVILVGIISLLIKGGPKLSLDFTGGTLIQLNFKQSVNINDINVGLKSIGFDAKELNLENNVLSFKLQTSSHISENKMEDFKNIINKDFTIEKIDIIGASVGAWLIKRSLLAFFLAFIGIIVYVGIRFSNSYFGIAGVLALIHDAFFIVTFFSVFNKEIDLTIIAAIMTVVGYSINDTIVIFDRIRENLKVRYKENVINVFNESINETLTRTILTTITTLIPTTCLLICSSGTLKNFSLALFIGFLVGTYSSIFIAVPLSLGFSGEYKKQKKQ